MSRQNDRWLAAGGVNTTGTWLPYSHVARVRPETQSTAETIRPQNGQGQGLFASLRSSPSHLASMPRSNNSRTPSYSPSDGNTEAFYTPDDSGPSADHSPIMRLRDRLRAPVPWRDPNQTVSRPRQDRPPQPQAPMAVSRLPPDDCLHITNGGRRREEQIGLNRQNQNQNRQNRAGRVVPVMSNEELIRKQDEVIRRIEEQHEIDVLAHLSELEIHNEGGHRRNFNTADGSIAPINSLLGLQHNSRANNGGHPRRPAPPFVPVHGGHDDDTASDIIARNTFNISKEYRGDPKLARNHSANIPEELNCSFWITGLPPNVTYHELLSEVRDVGRVFACFINAARAEHPNAAAKIVFFELESAQHFSITTAVRGFRVGGCNATVRKNRIRTAPQSSGSKRSRVLNVIGDENIVHPSFLLEFFRSKFVFQLDNVILYPKDPRLAEGVAHVEYRFGSYRSQSESAWIAIERDLEAKSPIYLFWGHDPCDVPDRE